MKNDDTNKETLSHGDKLGDRTRFDDQETSPHAAVRGDDDVRGAGTDGAETDDGAPDDASEVLLGIGEDAMAPLPEETQSTAVGNMEADKGRSLGDGGKAGNVGSDGRMKKSR